MDPSILGCGLPADSDTAVLLLLLRTMAWPHADTAPVHAAAAARYGRDPYCCCCTHAAAAAHYRQEGTFIMEEEDGF